MYLIKRRSAVNATPSDSDAMFPRTTLRFTSSDLPVRIHYWFVSLRISIEWRVSWFCFHICWHEIVMGVLFHWFLVFLFFSWFSYCLWFLGLNGRARFDSLVSWIEWISKFVYLVSWNWIWDRIEWRVYTVSCLFYNGILHSFCHLNFDYVFVDQELELTCGIHPFFPV